MSQQIVGSDGQVFSPDSRYLGGRGPVRITGTSPVLGSFYRIVPESGGATLSALVGIAGTWSGCAVPVDGLWAGTGNTITSITLTSGAAIAYQL
jgi:hypothetical protein